MYPRVGVSEACPQKVASSSSGRREATTESRDLVSEASQSEARPRLGLRSQSE